MDSCLIAFINDFLNVKDVNVVEMFRNDFMNKCPNIPIQTFLFEINGNDI